MEVGVKGCDNESRDVISGENNTGGVHIQYTDMWHGTTWTTQLLYGHPQRLYNLTRMRPDVFRKLLEWLQLYGGLRDTKLLSAVEKLLIFMLVFSNN